MNKKYLFGMLVSGAMLAACTVDDLNTAPVAQEVNPSAPVFTVTFGDDDVQNRAMYDDGNDYHALRWVEFDKMSLFHGIQNVAISNEVGELTNWQNAVYEAKKNDDGEASLDFYTAAMVQVGKAVMVYPADVDFRNPITGNLGQQSPIVKINKVQGAADRDSIPYISEVIDITLNGKKEGSDKANTAGVAGYDKKYEIAMKQAAGILRLVLDKIHPVPITDPDVAALKVKSVTIDLGENDLRRAKLHNTRPFSLELPVVATAAIDGETPFGKANPTWRYRTSLNTAATLADPSPSGKQVTSWSLKTTGVYESAGPTDTVFFNILPNSSAGADRKEILGGDLIVETNYGYVTIHNGAELFGKDGDKAFMDVLPDVIKGLWYDKHPNGRSESKWDGEYRGGYVGTRVTVDLDSLNMDGMHIQTDKELKDAIKVYEQLYAEKTGEARDVKFYLDGNASSTFEMTAATLALVEEQMNITKATGHGLKFEACGQAHPKACTKVKIQSGTTATEVPSTLIFETKAIEIQLAGDWTFSDVEVVNESDDSKDQRKVMTNVEQLTVLGNLELKNTIQVKNGAESGTILGKGIVIEKTGVVKVNGLVHLGVNTENFGTIKIEAGVGNLVNKNQLIITSNTTLNNREAQDVGTTKATGWDNGALIENGGTLTVLSGATDCAINNYGIINMLNKNSSVDITRNQDDGGSVNTVFNNTKDTENRMGTIILNDPTASQDKTVIRGAGKGFIKITINNDEVTEDKYGKVANYAIIAGTCSEVKVGSEKVGNTTYNYLPSNIKYVELQSSVEVRLTSLEGTAAEGGTAPVYTKFNLDGLFVKSGAVVIPEITTVNLGRKVSGSNITYEGKLYNDGYINALGKVNYAGRSAVGYYGEGKGLAVGNIE